MSEITVGAYVKWPAGAVVVVLVEPDAVFVRDESGRVWRAPPNVSLLWTPRYKAGDRVWLPAQGVLGRVQEEGLISDGRGKYWVELAVVGRGLYPETDLEPYVDQDKRPTTKPPQQEQKEMEYRRYSKAMIEATTKRPEVFLYQEALKAVGYYNGAVDGWYGEGSANAVKKFQADHGLTADGILGKGTSSVLIPKAEEAGYRPDLIRRIQSVIAFYEVSSRRNAYGAAENDIGDGAGANYGIMQCNSYGSVASLLKMAGRNDLLQSYNAHSKKTVNPTIQDFFGSTEGINAQNKYFEEKIVKGAMKELYAFGAFDAWQTDATRRVYWERAVLLFCDTRIQNGAMWSPNRKPFWKTLSADEATDPQRRHWPELFHGEWWNDMLGAYIKYDLMKTMWYEEYEKTGGKNNDKAATEAANQNTARRIVLDYVGADDPTAQLVVVAQIRARSSWDKYWFQAVGSRRITDATGSSKKHPSGVVNGSKVDLVLDFGFGVVE